MKKDVIKYEKILNETQDLYNHLQEILVKVDENQESFNELKEYYSSEEYRKDVDISNTSNDYDDIACGVLSEDGVYDLLATSYSSIIQMLETATEMLKNY